jgi:hypothetical protein
LHPWFDDGDEGTDGARLVNVAVSRARERLIIVADLSRIYRGRAHQTAIGRFFRTALTESQILAPRDLVAGNALLEGLDAQAMIDDMERTSATIEMWSKTVAPSTINVLRSSLIAASRRGCQVTIWHEPDSSGDRPAALEPLGASDVMLRPCLPVRESLAVLDDAVWASSGPILGPAPGATIRREHAVLADAVRRVTRRREADGEPGTGHPAGRCRCGRQLVRDETRGLRGVRTICLHCDARDGPRAAR